VCSAVLSSRRGRRCRIESRDKTGGLWERFDGKMPVVVVGGGRGCEVGCGVMVFGDGEMEEW